MRTLLRQRNLFHLVCYFVLITILFHVFILAKSWCTSPWKIFTANEKSSFAMISEGKGESEIETQNPDHPEDLKTEYAQLTATVNEEQQEVLNKAEHNPRFVFITNTEQCLDEYWTTDAFLGDPLLCDCDSIVISYHRPCKTNDKTHITYLFEPTANTLTKGKNIGVSTARKRTDKKYLYYIIHDDDVEYTHTVFQSEEKRKRNPLRNYQEFLLWYRPAVATPAFVHYRQHEEFLYPFQQRVCHKTPSNITAPITHFDACTYAMHAKAVPYLYPLPEGLCVSGILSHIHLQILSMVTFPFHVMTYLGTRTHNMKSKRWVTYVNLTEEEKKEADIPFEIPPPTEPPMEPNMRWDYMVERAKVRIPEEYHDLPLTKYVTKARARAYNSVKELVCGDLLGPGHDVIPFLLTKTIAQVTCVTLFTLNQKCPRSPENEWAVEYVDTVEPFDYIQEFRLENPSNQGRRH